MNMIKNGDALLSSMPTIPMRSLVWTEQIAAMQKTHLTHYSAISAQVSRNAMNWCVVASSSPAWAKKVFPDLKQEEAEEKLWQAILKPHVPLCPTQLPRGKNTSKT